MGVPFRSWPNTARRALIVLLALGGMALAVLAAGSYTARRTLNDEAAQARERLKLYAGTLDALIERYRALPAVLAEDAELRSALAGDSLAPPLPDVQARLNEKLERVNGAATSSTLTLLDRQGNAVAASNWRSPTSNVGHNYSFRPYFLQAREQGAGRFYAVGVTTGVPGYFLSRALYDERGGFVGVVVIKITLTALETEWTAQPDVVLVSDEHSVVFLANRSAWRYRALTALTARQLTELEQTQQYPRKPLQVLAAHPVGTVGTDTRRVRIEQPGAGGDYLWQSQLLPAEGWTIHLLRDTGWAVRAARIAELAAAGGWLTLVFLGLFLHQRWRLARLRQRSRAELEQLVKQHTAALRSAQDTLVQAAHLAVHGRDESLEHLPQGVSVVDADLRLRAWNRRYVELFNLPPELMVNGRPVEDVLRYNARRGLLGPGNPDDAVQRRLEHLRAARPYVFEREWPDGRVLEIRGNPLPGGGFVTSYADITSYKSAARDLRTLAETLERRVERRTEELQAAKAEAERANRSKTRFVAAAVHDLLQPLNAARMFVSALQARVQDPAERDLAANVEDALMAEDAILTSLLDIARLEAGAIETRIRDIALGKLFQALGREFGIVAQAKGLTLECVGTSAVVRTDEALLRRILQNFLSNAIRYTRRGRILLGCRRAGGDVRIEVWDTGPGVPEHLRAEIFEEFRRIDQGQGGERGAGLGLAIVDRIAHLLNHPIGLRSWVGRGSVFSVSVPQGDAAGVDERIVKLTVSEDSALKGRCVWYIEDDARVRSATSALLERWGCHVVLADGSGAPGVPGFELRPDLLLLDYRLGERTGPDLLPELRARWGSLPPVIIVSAERGPAVEGMARAEGWGYIPKPVRPAALRALMARMLPDSSPAKPPVSGCDTPACAEQP